MLTNYPILARTERIPRSPVRPFSMTFGMSEKYFYCFDHRNRYT